MACWGESTRNYPSPARVWIVLKDGKVDNHRPLEACQPNKLKRGGTMYLAIVRKVKGDWVIDKDSYHIFEDYGGNYLVQEIKIAEIRAIQSSEDEAQVKASEIA